MWQYSSGTDSCHLRKDARLVFKTRMMCFFLGQTADRWENHMVYFRVYAPIQRSNPPRIVVLAPRAKRRALVRCNW